MYVMRGLGDVNYDHMYSYSQMFADESNVLPTSICPKYVNGFKTICKSLHQKNNKKNIYYY